MKICPKCNKQFNDNDAFCDVCGTNLSAQQNNYQQQPNYANQSQPNYNPQQVNAYQPTMPNNPPKKKKTGMIIGIVAAVLIVLAIIGAVAEDAFQKEGYGSGTNGNDTGYSIDVDNNSSENSSSEDAEVNSEYNDILAEAGIVHFKSFFGLDAASFVTKYDNGNIYCADYGYQNDIVKQMFETLYVPVSGLDDAAKAELENNAKTEFAKFEAMSCCTVKYEMTNNYFIVTAEYNNLDKKENYVEMYEVGITEEKVPISMKLTEESVLADGAIKK